MIASLPMYDWPELRGATDAWWAGLARALRAEGVLGVPDRLTRGLPEAAVWEDPGLVLSQTCGLPFSRYYRDRLHIVMTPCYAAQGCAGASYSSAILVRADTRIDGLDELRARVAACNAADSLSGHLALRMVLAEMAPLNSVVMTGSHAGSMAAVRRGEADVCAIDCVTYAICRRHRPALTDGLRAIAWSPPMPALPYVTRRVGTAEDLSRLRAGLLAAMADPALAAARAELLLDGFELLPDEAYDVVARHDREAPLLRVSEDGHAPLSG